MVTSRYHLSVLAVESEDGLLAGKLVVDSLEGLQLVTQSGLVLLIQVAEEKKV